MDRLQWTEELRTGLVVSWSYFELYFLSMFRNCNSRYMFVCIPIYDFGLLQTRCVLHAADVSITTPGTTKESKPLVSNINYTYKFANDKKQKRKVGSPIETNESIALLYWKWWNVANKKIKPTLQKNYIYPSREPALNHLTQCVGLALALSSLKHSSDPGGENEVLSLLNPATRSLPERNWSALFSVCTEFLAKSHLASHIAQKKQVWSVSSTASSKIRRSCQFQSISSWHRCKHDRGFRW